MTPEQITEPGWYYRVDDDEYTRVGKIRLPIYHCGILRSGRPEDVERYEEVLICDGSTHPPDWGNEFIGPLPKPFAVPEEKALCPHGYFYRTCGLCNTEPSPEPGPSTEIAPPPGHECSAAETIQYAITLLEVSGGNPKVIEYLRAGLDQHEARSSPLAPQFKEKP